MKGTPSFLCYGPNATNEVMMEVCTLLMADAKVYLTS